MLAEPGDQAAIIGGLVFFGLGLAGSAGAWWERPVWSALVIAFAYQA